MKNKKTRADKFRWDEGDIVIYSKKESKQKSKMLKRHSNDDEDTATESKK